MKKFYQLLWMILMLGTLAHAQIFMGDAQAGGGGGSGSSFVVNAGGNGGSAGSATTSDGFINCVDTAGVITGTCSHTYSGSPSFTLTGTAGANTTVSFSNGTGGAASCSGSSNSSVSCSITISVPSTITVSFTSPAGSAIPGTYVGIGLNSNSTGCPPSGGHYPSTINHGRDRWWDLGQVQWASVNTGVDTYNWTNVDGETCAAKASGVDIHWVLARTPYFATTGQQHTDAGDCNYYSTSSLVQNTTANPNNITQASESGSIVTILTNYNPGAGALIVVQDISPAGYNGVFTVISSNATQITYSDPSTGLATTNLSGNKNILISTPLNLGQNAPAQCDPPNDVNRDGTGTNQTWRDWVGAIAAHTNAPGYLTTHAHISVIEDLDEPDTCAFFSCAYGSYDVQARLDQDKYCIYKGGAYYVRGAVTSGTFVIGESVTQATTGATATLMGAPIYSSDLLNFTAAPTGSPDSTHHWTGGTSGAVYTPNLAPTQMTIRATGETCLQVRTAVTHGAGSSVVNTTLFPSYPAQPLDVTATMLQPSYHPPDSSATQQQAYLYCNNPPGGVTIKEQCSSSVTGNTQTGCFSSGESPCCQVSGGRYTSCHVGAALTTEAIDEHYKPGPNVTTPTFENAMVTAIAEIDAILGSNELAKPLFLPEAAFLPCGWPSSNCGGTGSPWGVLEMESAFMGDYLIYTWSLNATETIWYDWNPSRGGIGSACSGSGITGNYCANTAMNTAFNWLVGSTMTGCSISNGAGTNSLYTCHMSAEAFPGPGFAPADIIWDNAELCSGTTGNHGTCPTQSEPVNASYTKCYDIGGNPGVTITSHAFPIGIQPWLCE